MIFCYGSHKGGVGKTTLVLNHANFLRIKGLNVIVVRADRNEDVTYWNNVRETKGLVAVNMIEEYGNLRPLIQELEMRFDIVIVDLAGHSSTELNSALSVADYVISPVCPTASNEIFTLQKFSADVKEVQKINPKLKGYSLLTRVEPNQNISKIVSHINKDDDFLPLLKSRISNLRAFRRAMNEGLTVHEMGSKANQAKAQIELFMQELLKLHTEQ